MPRGEQKVEYTCSAKRSTKTVLLSDVEGDFHTRVVNMSRAGEP